MAILPFAGVTWATELDSLERVMDKNLLDEIQILVTSKKASTEKCGALFDITHYVEMDLFIYYRIQHMKFDELSSSNFEALLTAEQTQVLSHIHSKDGTVTYNGMEIRIPTLVSEIIKEYRSFKKQKVNSFAHVKNAYMWERFKLLMIMYYQIIGNLVRAEVLPAIFEEALLNDLQFGMNGQQIVAMRQEAKEYFESRNYQVTVAKNVRFEYVEVPVNFKIVSSPLLLIKYFKSMGIPSLVVNQNEKNNVYTIEGHTSSDDEETSELKPPLTREINAIIKHYTLHRPKAKSANVKLTYHEDQNNLTLDPQDFTGEINNKYGPWNHLNPYGETEVAEYIRSLEPCFVFTDATLHKSIVKAMTRGIIVLFGNLAQNEMTKYQLLLNAKLQRVKIFERHIDENGNWIY